jgi:hypothetical protein
MASDFTTIPRVLFNSELLGGSSDQWTQELMLVSQLNALTTRRHRNKKIEEWERLKLVYQSLSSENH